MKFVRTTEKMAFCVAVTLVVAAGAVHAQSRVRGEADGRPLVKLRELTGYGPRSLIKSPDSGASKRSSSREWAELGVQYDSQPEWLDEVAFNYYVLLYRPKATPEFTLLKGAVTYVDVARGSAHLAVAFVRPAAMQRYGEIVGVAVEIKVKGEVADTLSQGRLGSNKPLPTDWWKTPSLIPKEGYILDKSKTPFALINFDEYEALK